MMNSRILTLVSAFACCLLTTAQPPVFRVTVKNPSTESRSHVPVVIALPHDFRTRSATLVTSPNDYPPKSNTPGTSSDFPSKSAASSSRKSLYHNDNTPIPYQLDDLDDDGYADELFFLTDLEGNEERVFTITLSEQKPTEPFTPRVYADMMLTNKKIKESNKQDLYISQLTVENGTNAYNMLHHHGAAFESELVGYRIYFDHRQTVDIYGKYHPGLELQQTQFYPDDEQKAQGFGDDVLWVGNTLGLGTLRGWDGQQPTMLRDVEHRSQRLVATGPLRVIIEMKDRQWRVLPGEEPINMTTRYTLMAGHRDCSVDILFEDAPADKCFVTGLINIKDSREITDYKGLRGCWGTDWPVSAKDSIGHKRETVGLGICVPEEYFVEGRPADADNYPIIVKPKDNRLHYDIVFCSDNEAFGYHSFKEWARFLAHWWQVLQAPVEVRIESSF